MLKLLDNYVFLQFVGYSFFCFPNYFSLLCFLLHFQEAVQAKGLRDDTTCIVVDILPQEKPAPIPPPKKQGKGVFKSMFRRKSSESSSTIDKEYLEPDVVEELFEEGSAKLSERFVVSRHSLSANMILFIIFNISYYVACVCFA